MVNLFTCFPSTEGPAGRHSSWMGRPDWVSVDPDPGQTVCALGPCRQAWSSGTHPVSVDPGALEHGPAWPRWDSLG